MAKGRLFEMSRAGSTIGLSGATYDWKAKAIVQEYTEGDLDHLNPKHYTVLDALPKNRSTTEATTTPEADEVNATPAALKLIEEINAAGEIEIDIDDIVGSGDHGKILKSDVQAEIDRIEADNV